MFQNLLKHKPLSKIQNKSILHNYNHLKFVCVQDTNLTSKERVGALWIAEQHTRSTKLSLPVLDLWQSYRRALANTFSSGCLFSRRRRRAAAQTNLSRADLEPALQYRLILGDT